MNGARPGGPLRASWTIDEGDVVLVLADLTHGGGIRLRFDTPAEAQAWVDSVAYDLDVISQPWNSADEDVA